MISEIRSTILAELSDRFNEDDLQAIDIAVAKAFQGYKVERDESLPVPVCDTRPLYVREFIARKKMKGCSAATIKQYELALDLFLRWAKKPLTEMTDLDILIYLDYTQSARKVSNRTVEHTRLILSSFYTFLQGSGRITVNPIKNIDAVKFTSSVRVPLSGEEMERIRDACTNLRDKALVEVLYSTGGRVSEVMSMNWTDIDWANNRMIITGKGDKQRYVFFNAKSVHAIQKYLESRDDSNPALFVESKSPHDRLSKSGMEYAVKQIGVRAGLERPLFPHLFRHTLATDMLAHGAPINEVSHILGHERIDTTEIYAKSTVDSLALSHKQHVA